MKQEILTKFPWLDLSTAALLIFFGFFVALLILINLKSQKKIYDDASFIPLNDPEILKQEVRRV